MGSATLSQLAFPGESKPEFPMGEIPLGLYNTVVTQTFGIERRLLSTILLSVRFQSQLEKSIGESHVMPRSILLTLAAREQGTWEEIFDERSTREGDFTTSSGDVVRVPMMSRTGQYAVKAVGEGVAARVLELPYGTDGRFSMFILLPDQADGLRDLESRLSSQVFVLEQSGIHV